MKLKQMLCLALALLMCISMLAGCGDSGMETNPPATAAPGGTDATPAGNDPAEPTGPFTPSVLENGVQMTADFVFEDPAEMDFDARYVFYFGPTNETVAMSAESGMQYYIMLIYAKEEVVKGMYTIYAFDTAENINAYAESMKANGTDFLAVDGCDTVMYTVTDEATCGIVVGAVQSSGAIEDTNASSFANYYTLLGGEMLK